MPPRRRSPAPPPVDIEAVRRKLEEGKIVRVGISRSAQFPDGGTGRVRRVGTPEADGEEYVQVEVNLNGTRDVLPFTPADLTPATRTRTAPAPSPAGSSLDVGRDARPGPAAPGSNEAPVQPARPTQSTSTPAAPLSPSPAAPTPPAPTRGKSTRAGKAAGKKSPPVAITIATTDTDPPQWKIEARVGARVLLRSAVVPPARVWELVQQLDVEMLTATVGGILEDQRRSAQARADALAAELARVRAELDALPDGRR